MTKVAFVILTSDSWTGGANYYKNLLFAISKLKGKKIQPVMFFSTSEKRKVIKSFELFGEIVKTDILDHRTFYGLVNAFLMRVANSSFMLEKLFKKHEIQIVSHSRFIDSTHKIKTINWITDFQHIHFPGMFSLFERLYRNLLFYRYAKFSDVVILSSESAMRDYSILFKNYSKKAKVLHFVAQPSTEKYKLISSKEIESKYNFSGKFFYLPNQLWKHKNHVVVLKALNLLKKEGKEILVICTGYMKDYRNKEYQNCLLRYVKDNNLENNIKFLGLVDHTNVLTLMRYSISIINPSLFEGWSTTVEEAKSVGKNMILSDISVHKEQHPPNSSYFDPLNEKQLAGILWKKWQESNGGPDYELEKIAQKNLEKRTEMFGRQFQKIVEGII